MAGRHRGRVISHEQGLIHAHQPAFDRQEHVGNAEGGVSQHQPGHVVPNAQDVEDDHKGKAQNDLRDHDGQDGEGLHEAVEPAWPAPEAQSAAGHAHRAQTADGYGQKH